MIINICSSESYFSAFQPVDLFSSFTLFLSIELMVARGRMMDRWFILSTLCAKHHDITQHLHHVITLIEDNDNDQWVEVLACTKEDLSPSLRKTLFIPLINSPEPQCR